MNMIDEKQLEEVARRTANMTDVELEEHIADLERQIKEKQEEQDRLLKAIEEKKEMMRKLDYDSFHELHQIREKRQALWDIQKSLK